MTSKKATKLQSIRGIYDLLPGESERWAIIEKACIDVLKRRGYAEIRVPILEQTQLFARSIGNDTDIVSKEMYTFEDRNGDSLTLRPEGTASCARAGIQHGLFYNQTQRFWYYGPMFRHERPQKGRNRQFYQLGAEAYGWSGPDIEAELIAATKEMFEELGLKDTVLQINTLGDAAARDRFRDSLRAFLTPNRDELDEDSQRRLDSNPLRILDSKVPTTQALLEGAPNLHDCLDDRSRKHFEQLQRYLQALGIDFEVNDRLVRGLDYYNDTVFEWVNADFGAQATVCAGGRYDGLVEQIGGAATPAFGFAMGMDRLVQILEEQAAAVLQEASEPDVYLMSIGNVARAQALRLQQALSSSGYEAVLHCGDGGLKNQFKKADKSGARIGMIIGEQEAAEQTVGVKALQRSTSHSEQQTVSQIDAVNVVTNWLKSL